MFAEFHAWLNSLAIGFLGLALVLAVLGKPPWRTTVRISLRLKRRTPSNP